jgi:hypothetical protein
MFFNFLRRLLTPPPAPWLPLEEIIATYVVEPQRSQILSTLAQNPDLLVQARGSTNNHQAWPGGWNDHYADGMNVALFQFEELNRRRPLPFSLHDVLVAFFAHDIEKPWKYDYDPSSGEWSHKNNFATKEDANNFRLAKLAEYGIELTILQKNAMECAEGELGDKYNPRERYASELAGLVHAIDHISARVWHGAPYKENDPWKGARRVLTPNK